MRADPYVIEACFPAEAVRTQLSLLVKPLYELCTKVLESIEGNPLGAANEAAKVLATSKPSISRFRKEGHPKEVIVEIENAIALTVMRCAVLHGNASNKWAQAVTLLEEAAALGHDKEIADLISRNLLAARKNHRLFKATYYFVALFFPLFPICRYRVIATPDGYRFLGKGSLRPGDWWHIAVSVVVILLLPILMG